MLERTKRYFLTSFSMLLASLPLLGYDKSNVIWCFGYAHIDTAWLWPKDETLRQTVPATFNDMLNLMRANADLHYATTCSLHYQSVRDYRPDIFQQVQKKVAEGMWETMGGEVIEPDVVMPSGESTVRQFLYGKRFFKQEFGKDIWVSFLPDSFGFNANFPQILKKSGIDFWSSSKLTWNDTNQAYRGPFIWRGIDGSEVTAYNLASTYAPGWPYIWTLPASLDAVDALGIKDSLHVFGWGDHGGGPDQFLVSLLRIWNLFAKFSIKFARVDDYVDQILTPQKSKLPTIDGELYLELHRGTYTTYERTKIENRLSETKADESERLSSALQWLGGTYPYDELTDMWNRVILVNQSHDVLPGTSVESIYSGYNDTDGGTIPQYTKVLDRLDAQIQTASRNIANNMDTQGAGTPLVVVNPLSFTRRDVVEAEIGFDTPAMGARVFEGGKEIPSQLLSVNGNRARFLFVADQVPPIGAKVYHVQNQRSTSYQTGLYGNGTILENSRFRLALGEGTGNISSL